MAHCGHHLVDFGHRVEHVAVPGAHAPRGQQLLPKCLADALLGHRSLSAVGP